jgi:hypothetical protein
MPRHNPDTATAMRSLIQIVPFRSTNPDGVGDYARLLADRLKRDHGLETIFIVANPDEGTAKLNDGWRTETLAARDGQSLIKQVQSCLAEVGDCPIIFHLSAYGYHNRGIPLWLPGAMKAIKRGSNARLITVFHELFASARPWKSAFWLGWVQARIAARIAGLSDGGLTTVGVYEDWLRPRMRAGSPLLRVPVFSNMGEPHDVPPTDTRPNQMVVFGTGGLASLAYGACRAEAEMAARATGVESVIDIGSRKVPPPAHLGGVRVFAKGRLEADAVSRELLSARFALLPYDTTRLGKSTIFAALAAHGVVPICLGSEATGADGLFPGEHFIMPEPAGPLPTLSAADAARIQQNLIDWYAGRGLASCAQAIASLMGGHKIPESEATPQC